MPSRICFMLPADFDGLLFEHAAEKMYSTCTCSTRQPSFLDRWLCRDLTVVLFCGLTSFQVMLIALYDGSAVQRGEKSIRLCPFGERLEEK